MARLTTALAASIALVVGTIGIGTGVGTVAPAAADPSVQPAGSMPIPDGPAPAWIVADLDTGQVLAGRDMYAPHPPASTIKTLLALTALDEVNLDATVVATPANTFVECNCAGIQAGRTYTAGQLLDAVLLVSGNDAANTLADLLGGYDVAVDKMNAKAAAIGATNTHATSPSGLDGPGGAGWTTPHDLAAIFRAAMANPVFAYITARPTALFPTDTGERPLINQNDLLVRYPGAIGGKTGFTTLAGGCLAVAVRRGGHTIVGVILNTNDIWGDMPKLMDAAFKRSPA